MTSRQNEQTYKPGQTADKDLTLSVIGNAGEKIGEIKVKKGERIPPYRSEDGVSEYREA